MIFDNLPSDFNDAQKIELAIRRFRELRSRVFKVLPKGCLLKPQNVLATKMFLLLDTETIPNQEHLCSLCSETACPYNPGYILDPTLQ